MAAKSDSRYCTHVRIATMSAVKDLHVDINAEQAEGSMVVHPPVKVEGQA